MVSLGQLWLPILIAAVACHLVGFLMWMLLPHHRSDWSPVPDEGALRNLLKGKLAPGLYIVPFGTHADMRTPEMVAKRTEGPNLFLTVLPNGVGSMTPYMVKNLLFHAFVSLLVAYVGVHALPIGTGFGRVIQVLATAGILAYALNWGHATIWFGKPFKVAMKEAFDGLVMALVTAAIFGWLWPH